MLLMQWVFVFVFLQNPIQSYEALNRILTQFEKASGNKINNLKLAMIGLNMSIETKSIILSMSQATWREKMRYLGVIIVNSLNIKHWINSIFHPLINFTGNQLKEWVKMELSRFG